MKQKPRRWFSAFLFHWIFWAAVNTAFAFLVVFGSANSQPGEPAVKLGDLSWLFLTVIPWTVFGSSLFALFIGTMDFLSSGEHRRRHTFLFWVTRKFFFSFAGFILGCAIPIALGLALKTDAMPWQGIEYYLPRTIAIVVFAMIALAVLSAAREMIFNIGKKNAGRILTGKYFHPQEEEWAFLFIDMKGSTSLAEKIGHGPFSRLVQHVALNMNRAAETWGAEVYKYVGDGAILCWPVPPSFDAQIIVHCFEEFLVLMNSEQPFIKKEFGAEPQFKAGAHLGMVTVSEIGDTKREIAFYGDVVNTASRIESACSTLKKTFLLSDTVHAHMQFSPMGEYNCEKIEGMELRGKSEPMTLWAWNFPKNA